MQLLTSQFYSASIMTVCPLLVIFYWIALSLFHGSLTEAYQSMLLLGPGNFLWQYAPRPTLKATLGYCIWILFQAALYQLLPSKLSTGQLTPAGILLKYRTNGLLAWAVTHGSFLFASVTGYLDAAVLAKNWEGLIVAANIYGFLLSGFAYLKAVYNPTHEGDCKFSGTFTNQEIVPHLLTHDRVYSI